MNAILRTALAISGFAFAAQASAEVIIYEHDGFAGRTLTAEKQIDDLGRSGFDDRASSAVVMSDRWEVCEDAQFAGRCIVLRPGRYASFSAMGLNDRISSVRRLNGNARVEESRYAPSPQPVYDNRRRNRERLFEANVTSVRAVLGPSEQRCWVEREQVDAQRGDRNVGGAIVGALIGGVLGHQVGGGRGKDVATAGGAIAGALVGSNVGRDGSSEGYSRDVKRCETTNSQASPAYWDVTYEFRGVEHRVQMATPPGATVSVNKQGEPRA